MFKFNQKNVFLTYAKCPLSVETIHEALGKIAPIAAHCSAIEAHKDGTPHVHTLISFGRRVHTTDCRKFDVGDYHPNIEKVQTKDDQLRIRLYVRKSGSYVDIFPEIQAKRTEMAKSILAEGLSKGILERYPELIFQNLNNIKGWLSLVQAFNCSKLSPVCTKLRHTWVYGPPNSGKTTWLRELKSLYICTEIPENNDYSELALRHDTEILYVDEFKGFLTIQQLNKLCDGDTLLNTKGGSVRLGYVWVIVVSNASIPFCYNNSDEIYIKSLYTRFRQYDMSINTPPFPKYSIKN